MTSSVYNIGFSYLCGGQIYKTRNASNLENRELLVTSIFSGCTFMGYKTDPLKMQDKRQIILTDMQNYQNCLTRGLILGKPRF